MFKAISFAVMATMLMVGTAYADLKVGIFNAQSVAMDSEPAKAAQKRLQTQFGAERSQLEKQAQDLQKQGEDLQSKAATLSEKAREEKQIEFLRKRREFEEKSRDFARRVQTSEEQIRQAIAKIIYQSASNVAQQKKLDLILDGASGSIIYAVPSMDVTKEMLNEVNNQWKANGGKFDLPAASAPAKPAPAKSGAKSNSKGGKR